MWGSHHGLQVIGGHEHQELRMDGLPQHASSRASPASASLNEPQCTIPHPWHALSHHHIHVRVPSSHTHPPLIAHICPLVRVPSSDHGLIAHICPLVRVPSSDHGLIAHICSLVRVPSSDHGLIAHICPLVRVPSSDHGYGRRRSPLAARIVCTPGLGLGAPAACPIWSHDRVVSCVLPACLLEP